MCVQQLASDPSQAEVAVYAQASAEASGTVLQLGPSTAEPLVQTALPPSVTLLGLVYSAPIENIASQVLRAA